VIALTGLCVFDIVVERSKVWTPVTFLHIMNLCLSLGVFCAVDCEALARILICTALFFLPWRLKLLILLYVHEQTVVQHICRLAWVFTSLHPDNVNCTAHTASRLHSSLAHWGSTKKLMSNYYVKISQWVYWEAQKRNINKQLRELLACWPFLLQNTCASNGQNHG